MNSIGNPHATADSLYAAVLRFYARQVGLLDADRIAEWAQTFTEDAVFEPVGRPQPWRGRAEIAASMRSGTERIAGEGLRRRHWLGMISVISATETAVYADYYAAILTVRGGQTPDVQLSATGTDLLLRTGASEELVVAHRWVEPDRAALAGPAQARQRSGLPPL